MKSSHKALKIVCAGMMQSWRNTGLGSYVRYTELMPTKSGITGMIACALGYPRNDPRIVQLKNSFELYIDTNESGPLYPDSVDKIPDVMVDYQTVSAIGMKKAGGGTLDTPSIINKEYIVNYKFVLYITADTELLNKIKDALVNPVWQYYLGSKNCIPSEPVCRGIVENIDLEENVNVFKHIRM